MNNPVILFLSVTNDHLLSILILESLLFRGAVGYLDIFFRGGGVQQSQLRTQVRENGDLGSVAP
jgi:hypothetical protein